jgi:hypothetical protein
MTECMQRIVVSQVLYKEMKIGGLVYQGTIFSMSNVELSIGLVSKVDEEHELNTYKSPWHSTSFSSLPSLE